MSRFENLDFDAGRVQAQAHERIVSERGEQYYLTAARTAFENGRFEEALRAYARVLEFNPRLAEAWTGQVRMLIELGEFEEAGVWADKALASFPNEAELLAARAVALARNGDLQGAISFSDAAVESQTNTPYIWLARADVLLARKEKRAEFCFEKAFALASRNWFTLWLGSRIQAFHRHFARALKLAQEALEGQPGRAVLWVQTAECHLALGLAEQARNAFEQAHELDPAVDVRQSLREADGFGWSERLVGLWRRWSAKS